MEEYDDITVLPEIMIRNTKEKYFDLINELILEFVGFLRYLSLLEEKTMDEYQRIRAEKVKSGIPKWQTIPEETELVDHFKKTYELFAKSMCSETLLKRGCGHSFSKPAPYTHIDKGCLLEVAMRSCHQMTIIMYNDCEKDWLATYKFVLKYINDCWKINAVYYRHGNDDSWHIKGI